MNTIEQVENPLLVYYVPGNRQVIVYDPDTIFKLHSQYRLVPTLVGTLPMHPMQNLFFSKPAVLAPEAVTIALEKGWIRLIEDSNVTTYENIPTSIINEAETGNHDQKADDVKMSETNSVESTENSSKVMHEASNSVHTLYQPTIYANKTKQEESNNNEVIIDDHTKSDQDEPPRKKVKLSKPSAPITYFQMSDSDSRNPKKCIKEKWVYPETDEQRRRYLVFKDLHDKGYFMTAGDRFGCDFLAYKDDPLIVHSEWMVFVVDYSKEIITPHAVVSLGRLGNTSHKTSVYATVHPSGEIKYMTINWFSNLQPLKEFKKYIIKNQNETTEAEDTAVALTETTNNVPEDVVISEDGTMM